jgi:hypothetical protein
MGKRGAQVLINFVGGEISPLVAQRSDLEVLLKSLSRCENFIPLPQGGLRKRPGSVHVGLTKNNRIGSLIPFQFSAQDALMIVATDRNFRYYRNRAVVLNAAVNITGIDKANPAKVYAPQHSYANGTEVYIKDVGGMTSLNNRFFLVADTYTNRKTISSITKANPGIFTTSTNHGLSVGQRINISGATGMTQVNGNWLVNTIPTSTTFTVKDINTGVPLDTTSFGTYVANSGSMDASSFTLQDQWGTAIDASAYGAFTSGGTVASIYETTTPYLEDDLSYIRTAQTADIMYINCRNEDLGTSYDPQKLIRNDFTDWDLVTYKRKSDPFPVAPKTVFTPTAITKSNPARVTVASTSGLNNGDIVYMQKILGMTELSGNFYQVANKTPTTFTLQDVDGNNVDSTSFTTFVAGAANKIVKHPRSPGCVAFSADGRLTMAATDQNPEGWWASRTPNGFLNRYEDFTLSTKTGSAADPTNGMAFSFSPVDNKIDTIREMKQFGANFALLGASSIRLIYGAQRNQPPTPIAINTLPTLQGAARVPPLVINWNLLFVDVNKQRLRGLQYNLAYDTFQANDYNLTSEHLGLESDFIRLATIKNTPDMIFCLRKDGTLLACTFNNIENIAGWTRIIAGGNGKILDIATIRQENGADELWLIVERVMNGKTYRTIEVVDVWPVFPSKHAFYTSKTAKKADMARWANAAWEAGKKTTFLDSSLTYDGTARGVAANANLTISGTATGLTITITASAPVFQSSDVGAQIWKSYNATGVGGGTALITQYVSATQVQALVKSDFDSTAMIPAGSWAFAVTSLSNLDIYEGITVDLQVDGGRQPSQTVSGGKLTLSLYASKVQVGFAVKARAILPDVSVVEGAAARVRAVTRIRAKLHESIGGYIGPDPYTTVKLTMNKATGIEDRVPEPFTGTVDLPQLANWGRDGQQPTITHDDPTPFTLLYLEPEGLVSEA